MPTYIMLSKLTVEGRQALHEDPTLLMDVGENLEGRGCKLLHHFALLGEYDFLSIIEAPDNETMAHLVIEVGARGSANYMVLPALSIQELLLQMTDHVHLAP